MSTATVMTEEEEDRLLAAYREARDRGDMETACKIGWKIPIHPALAPFVREHYSKERIKELGIILPESEG